MKAYILHPEWADDFVKRHIEYCSYLFCTGNSNIFEFEEKLRNTKGQEAITNGFFDRQNYTTIINQDPLFNSSLGIQYKVNMQTDLQSFSDALKMTPTEISGYPLSGKNIIEFIDWTLYCKPVNNSSDPAADLQNSWVNSCNPDVSCRSLNSKWDLYRNYYLQLRSKYVAFAKRTANPDCRNCFL